MTNPVIAELLAGRGLTFFCARLIDLARGDIDFVDAEGFGDFVGTCHLQIAQHALFFAQNFPVEVELAAGHLVIQPDFAEDVPLGMVLVDGVDSLTVEGVENALRVNSVVRRLFEVGFPCPCQEFRHRSLRQSTVKGFRHRPKRRQEHTPLPHGTSFQAFLDGNMLPCGADEFCCRHNFPPSYTPTVEAYSSFKTALP